MQIYRGDLWKSEPKGDLHKGEPTRVWQQAHAILRVGGLPRSACTKFLVDEGNFDSGRHMQSDKMSRVVEWVARDAFTCASPSRARQPPWRQLHGASQL